MGGGGTTYQMPAQPSYGEGMRESLEAQVALLTGDKVGESDFRGVGSLESLLPLEESIRKKTAQTDTDVLRQTLLGSGSGGETQEVRYDSQGRIITGTKPGKTRPAGNYKFTQSARANKDNTGTEVSFEIRDAKTGNIVKSSSATDIGFFPNENEALYEQMRREARIKSLDEFEDLIGRENVEKAKVEANKGGHFGNFKNFQVKAEALTTPGEPIYAKDSDGNIIQDISKANTVEVIKIPAQRAGDGMIDLLGDTRNITQYETKTATQADVDAGLADEVGKQFVQQVNTTDQAGFRDGEFKGLSAMAEDIQRGNLSRQREADLQDVARLEPLFGQIMEDYKPGTTSALTGAKDLIEEQKDNLLGEVGISDPTKVQAQGVQADALRAGLMSDAEEALGQGLTDREERQIAEAARARSTMMGRTFDQSGAIAEAEARVAEDNQRRMQNRGFAQSVLGQEAGIQTSDDTRSMQADQFNVASQMDAEKLRESLRQQGLLGYLDAASRVSQLENQGQLDPFQAILGRSGGGSLQAGQSVFGQAGYGLNAQPAYLNPESGLGYIQNQATNAANMYSAQVAADATRNAGIMSGIGSAAGGLLGNTSLFCWVAREVYGEHNPAWKMFRMWMFLESPSWFFKLYKNYGERFASFIADKPRLKAVIRKWMDSKIRR
jgi:hypothetical protein